MDGKLFRTKASKWHLLDHVGKFINKWAHNPEWKPGIPWDKNDPRYIPYNIEVEEERHFSACGILIVLEKDVSSIKDIPEPKANGRIPPIRMCAYCMPRLMQMYYEHERS